MARLAELIAQREALNAEIEQVRAQEKEQELPRLIALVKDYHLTEIDLFDKPARSKVGRPVGTGGSDADKPRATKVGKGIPKYRNPETGQTWSGLGRQPAWFHSDQSEKFAIPS